MRHEQGKPRRQFKNYNNFNTKLKKKEFKKYPKDTGLMVTVRGDTEQDMTKAMKRFKRIVKESGVLQEYKDRQYFQKPSLKRRLRKEAGIKKWKRERQRLVNERGY
jgi:small subunit ribosomal protein S21